VFYGSYKPWMSRLYRKQIENCYDEIFRRFLLLKNKK
jgi:hypothetical protein